MDKRWFNELLKSRGVKSQKALARAIGLDGPKLTNLLNGKRKAQIHELLAMSHFLDAPLVNLIRCFAAKHITLSTLRGLRIRAGIFDDDRVIFLEITADYNENVVDIPIGDYPGMAVIVETETLGPRYFKGEVLAGILRPDPDPIDVKHLVGREAFVLLPGDGIYLKILQAGSKPNLYNLTSLNVRIPPIVDTEVVWGAPIDFHVPGWVRPKYRLYAD